MEQQELQISTYLKNLWKGKWIILATTLSALIGVVAFDLFMPESPPTFTAFATVKVEPVSAPEALTSVSSVSPIDDRSLNTQIQLIRSRNVMERALAKLNPQAVKDSPTLVAVRVMSLQQEINVRAIANTNLLEVRAKSPDQDLAQAKANAVVAAYIDYVKEERTLAIEEALEDIKKQLQGSEGGVNNTGISQLVVLFPSLGAELTNVAQSLEKSTELVAEIQSTRGSGNVEFVAKREVPVMKQTTAELEAISRDLQRIRSEFVDPQQPGTGPAGKTFGTEITRLENTADQLSAISAQLSGIRSKVNRMDPKEAFRISTTRAEDALVALHQVTSELDGVQPINFITAQQISSIESYVDVVTDDLQDVLFRLERASSGLQFNKSDRVLLRGQLLANTLGLRAAAGDLQDMRGRAQVEDFSGLEINRISAAEVQINEAMSQIGLISAELDSTADLGSLNDGLAEVRTWISESQRSLITISKEFLKLDSGGDASQERGISVTASLEIEDIALTLQVATSRLRSLTSSINDPLLRAQLITATARLNSAQQVIVGVAARLGGSILGQPPQALADGLRSVDERIRANIESLLGTVDAVQPRNSLPSTVLVADSAINMAENTSNVVRSLDIANRQLRALLQGYRDPILSGELEELADRMFLTYANLKDSSDRLNVAAENGTDPSSRKLEGASVQIESASNFLRAAADIAQQNFTGLSDTQTREATDEFREQVDIGAAMLDLIINDLTGIQFLEVVPVRYGQLAVLAGQIRASQTQATNISDQTRQLQQGRGSSYLNLQQLRAELEVSLLQPQETGITLVDSAVVIGSIGRKASFFSRVRLPVGAMGGFFLGCLVVLAKAQLNRKVNSPNQLRDRLALPVLGVVPKAKRSRQKGLPNIADHNGSAFSEALQLVGASLAGPLNNGMQSLLITSPGPTEGKTMLAVNLARVLAQYGHKVLLVDGNLRKPDVARMLNLPQEEGLSTALNEENNPVDYIEEIDTFAVLPGGKSPSNSVELLSSPAMSIFLQQSQRKYDMVIIDGPPILGFAELKALARGVSGAVLIAKAGVTSLDEAVVAKEELEASGISWIGTVLNFASEEDCAHLKHEKYGSVGANGPVSQALGKN